ncbi:MAG: precorrin-4 C(11)-methyltransferase [Proteobacteria bacterium]|nr:precorrin-4 C(11)-methyltransferase [Pseudomonadota bacterium]
MTTGTASLVPIIPMVHFIGAGPGDPELLTLKGKRLIEEAGLVLYAGSLVPPEVVACANTSAEVIDSAPLNLEETHALMTRAIRAGKTVARVHTGDPSLYGAIREQMTLLDREGIAYDTTPGVTASFATAAAACRSFTVPEATQTLIITRLAGRTPVPEAESLRRLAAHGAAMAIYLSAGDPEKIQAELLAGGLPESTLVTMGYRVGWPDQQVVECTLNTLAQTARTNGFTKQTVFLVLPGEAAGEAASLLYDKTFTHQFRKGRE